jgi:hypothetical protein
VSAAEDKAKAATDEATDEAADTAKKKKKAAIEGC